MGVALFVQRNLMAEVPARVAHFAWHKFAQEAVGAGMCLLFEGDVQASDRIPEDFWLVARVANRGVVSAFFDHLDFKPQLLDHLPLVEAHDIPLPGNAARNFPEACW